MRILLLNYEFPPIGGGGGRVTHALGRHFAADGHDVRLITSRYGDLPAREIVDGIRVERVPVLRKRPNVCGVHEMMTYIISGWWAARRLLTVWTPDIVQAFFGIPSGPVAYLLQISHGLRYVVFLGGRDVPRRNPDPPAYRLWYGVLGPMIRSIWGHAAAVVACSEGLRDLALRTAPEACIQVIPDGTDLSRFQPVIRTLSDAPVRLLGIGRLVPRKGFHLLLQAAARLKSSLPFQLDIVGDGPERARLEALAGELGLSDCVRFVGAVPYERLEQHYQKADVFVLPSLAEGMPLVVLEAMACGLPIVASRVQGIEELVVPDWNGYLASPGDAEDLAARLRTILDVGERRFAMGHHSVERVKPYDWSHVARRYLDLYRSILVSRSMS